MSIYSDRISALQQIMRDKGIDYYLIPLSDYHNSEYFDDYYNVIKYVSGFTGSNATLLIGVVEVYLWTDGRYFIQAEMELKDSGITLMKQGVKGVPDVARFLSDNMKEDEVLAFDGRLINVSDYERYSKAPGDNRRIYDADIIGEMWLDRGRPYHGQLWILPEEYAGETLISKISRIRDDENYKKADALIVSDLCDIAWTLNIRGGDIRHMPVFYSYLIITGRNVILYADIPDDSEVIPYLDEERVILREYEDIYTDLADKHFYEKYGIYKTLIDESTCNTAIYTMLNEYTEVLKVQSVIGSMKCIKNGTELDNIRKAHIKDGVAVTKFLYFIDKKLSGYGASSRNGEPDSQPIEYFTELKLADILHNLRSEQEGFLDESFDTISAWAEHGAIVHYEPTEETDAAVGRDNFLLVDSGGHYMEGTTDITRTVCIGEPSSKMKYEYTLVLKSNINLAKAIFIEGTGGKSLDMLARDVMWQKGYDYLHGTGHGVGYLLSVHEGPNNISVRSKKDISLKSGMVTTDEPGIYLEDKYGIRLENELLCRDYRSGEAGTFVSFECLTLAPFQPKSIDVLMLTREEKDYLNNYHKKVYDIISPYLNEDEREWLKETTQAI